MLCNMSVPSDTSGKESTCQAGNKRGEFDPWVRKYPGGGHGNPLQYSCLENPLRQRSLMDYSSQGHKESGMTEQLSTA